MIEWWGPVLTEYWGSTEGGVFTLVDSNEWLTKPGTVGKAIPTYEVFAVDADGERLPAGEIGTLYTHNLVTDEVFEYHQAEEKTAAAHLAPGTFTMGDVGHVDEDGYVFLSDRAANMIISGGVNIYPAEIEQVLIDHPAVADVAVFGIPDDEWGEQVKAAVELQDGYEPSTELEADLLALRAGAAGRVQGAALGRLRGRAAAPPDRQALHAPPPRPLLAGPRRDLMFRPRTRGSAPSKRSRPSAGAASSHDERAGPGSRRWCVARSASTSPGSRSSSGRARTASTRRSRSQPRVRAAARLARATCEDAARRLGMSRRDFLRSSMASAATLLAIGACSGDDDEPSAGTFDVPPESTTEPEVATTVLDGGGAPVLDVQQHLLELEGYEGPSGAASRRRAAATATPASTPSTGSTWSSDGPTPRWPCSRRSRCCGAQTRSRRR